MRRPAVARRGSSGSATIWALLTVLLIWAAAAVAVVETYAVQLRHRVAAAADAAALAAAGEGGLDPRIACAAAGRATARVGSELVGCVMSGPFATVTVRLAPPPLLRWAGSVTARARAGPADTAKPARSPISRTAS